MDTKGDTVVASNFNTDLNKGNSLDSKIDINLTNKENNYDPEKNDYIDDYIVNNLTPTYIRHGFVRKVFLIVLMQLIVTFSIMLMCYYVTPIRDFFIRVPYLGLIAGIILLIMAIVIAIKPKLLRKRSLGIVYICSFTFLFTVMVVAMTCYFDMKEILITMGITTAIVTALIIFSAQSKYDFTSWVGYMYFSLIFIVCIGMFAGLSNLKAVRIVLASIFTFIICVYILIDVQLIVGGKKKYQFNVDDYILAAITLYSDIISLFIQLLRIIGGAGGG